MDLLEQLTRHYATKVTHDGQMALATNGVPVLEAAFVALGWSDPHLDSVDAPVPPVDEAAVADVTEESDVPDR